MDASQLKPVIPRPDPDVVIVGCGPAGIAASIQLQREGLRPVVFERQKVGGLLVNANLVENYPGFPEGISGIDLARRMRDQVTLLGVDVVRAEVTAVDLKDDLFHVETARGGVRTRALIIASGTRPLPLPSVRIPKSLSDRVVYEIDTIRAVRERRVVIVGAGDAAFDYALSLEKHNDVTVLARGPDPRCLGLLWQRAAVSRRISFVPDTEVREIGGVPGQGLSLTCRSGHHTVEMAADHLVIAIGREPDLGFLGKGSGVEARGKQGFMHLIGDVRRGNMRQTAIAVGDGVVAAMAVGGTLGERLR